MMKRIFTTHWAWLAVAVAASVAAVGWHFHKSAVAAAPYRTTTASRGDIVQIVTANGQLSPLVTVDVGAQVSGNILKLYADYNSEVTNGQLIAELDPATYEAKLVQAQNDLANARAVYNLARVSARRAEELLKNKLVAQSDYDQTMAQLEQDEATLKSREAALQSAEVDLSRTKIYSPISGTVIAREMNVGQTVQANFSSPTLFEIANDLTRMQIAAMVSEADIGGVAENQEVGFTVDAFPERTFTGHVSQIRNQATTSANVVTYATMIDVLNADLKLKPGMTANASIITAKRENVIRIPNTALRFSPPKTALIKVYTNPPTGGNAERSKATNCHTVYLVSANTLAGGREAGELQPVQIGTGITDGSFTEGLAGLKEGDVLVTGMAAAQSKTSTTATSSPFGGGGPPP